jgi:hypothetical protein
MIALVIGNPEPLGVMRKVSFFRKFSKIIIKKNAEQEHDGNFVYLPVQL